MKEKKTLDELHAAIRKLVDMKAAVDSAAFDYSEAVRETAKEFSISRSMISGFVAEQSRETFLEEVGKEFVETYAENHATQTGVEQ
ncbi:MAG: hypothetical protein PHE17_05275 [Thiothrix sp.]|uniref:hypothetical protein n=1 Tax=Thiothrix sp. TaxID=1032 RepID=UPI0026293319|nr:hypothetical protein [Thiothrix sp.]MDD5392413.1 hypothetical protein [Thiothrix sp.]